MMYKNLDVLALNSVIIFLQDYPSVSFLRTKLKESKIVPIIAVTSSVQELYAVSYLLFAVVSIRLSFVFSHLLVRTLLNCRILSTDLILAFSRRI